MKRLSLAQSIAAAAVAFGSLAAVSTAHAGTDVVLSIGLPTPFLHVQHPVHVQPQPRYVQPQPVYVQPQPRYVQPQHVYIQPYPGHDDRRGGYHQRRGVWGDADRDGVPNLYDRDSRFYDHRAARHYAWGDADRDGVPNRYDPAPHNPYRR